MFKFHTCKLGSFEQVAVSSAATPERAQQQVQQLNLLALPWSPASQSVCFSADSSNPLQWGLSHNSCSVQKGQSLCLRAQVNLVCVGGEMGT